MASCWRCSVRPAPQTTCWIIAGWTGRIRRVAIDGENALTRGATAQVGFVFQHYALFRTWTCSERRLACACSRARSQGRGGRSAPRQNCSIWCSSIGSPTLSEQLSAASGNASRWRVRGDRAAHPAARRAVRRARSKCAQELQAMAAFAAHRDPCHLDLRHPRQEEPRSRQPRRGDGQANRAIGSPGEVYDNPATAFVQRLSSANPSCCGRCCRRAVRLDGAP